MGRSDRLVVAAVMLIAVAGTGRTAVAAGPSRSQPSVVKSISATEAADGATALVIAVSARPTFTTWKLEQPARVVIDISGSKLGAVDVPFDAGTFAVGAVAASVSEGDGGSRTRVVVTLRRAADYDIDTEGNKIALRVRPHERPAAPVAVAVADKIQADKAQADKALAAAENRRFEAEKVKREAEATRSEAERSRTEVERSRGEVERSRGEVERSRTEVNALARKLQDEKAAIEARKREAEAAERAAQVAAQKLAAERSASEQAARQAAEKQASAQAAALASAQSTRQSLETERKQLDALRAQLEARGKALAEAEAQARKSQGQSAQLARRAEDARARESEREQAARAATAKLEERRHELDSKLAAQQAQQRKLAEAERLVNERDAELARAAALVASREQAASAAASKLSALARQAGASEKVKQEAQAALAQAERERKSAQETALRSKRELAQAVAARRKEEERKGVLERERQAEEARLAQAGARRAAEEQRLAQAARARQAEEAKVAAAQQSRSKLESDRARLESERQALLADIARLRKTATNAIVAAPSAPPPGVTPGRAGAGSSSAVAPPPLGTVAVAPSLPPAPPAAPVLTHARSVLPAEAPARPRSITLRAPSRVQRIDFIDEPAQSSVIVELDEPSHYDLQRLPGGRVSLRLYQTDLPQALERSLDATEYLGPVKVVSSYRDPAARGSVRIDVDMAEEVPNSVRVDPASGGARIVWSFKKAQSSAAFEANIFMPRRIAGFSTAPLAPALPMLVAQAASPQASAMRPGAGKRRYTGRRIDLDFKGADIHNILRLLADVGGVNIVTSDDVKGEVTIKMRDVPWDQALDVVLRQKQLGQVREGNLIRVAPLTVLEKELEQEIARQKQITEVLPTETRLIGVSYADAKNLVERTKDLLSPRGKVSVDERTNTLIVSDVGRNLGLVEELVRNLDTQTSQVIIEARIVEARSTFVRQIGVQWGGTGFADTGHGNPTGLVFPHNIGIGGGATDGDTPLGGLVPSPRSGTGAANPNFAVNLPAAVGTGSGGALGLTLGSVAGAFNLNLRLSAMESTGQVRILSSPRISTMDNNEAHIEQGVSIPISVVSAQGVQTVFVDANLNLTVKPHVTNDGTVMMDIKVTRNEPDFVNTGARGDPTILKKEAMTKMLVRDGDTAVIGGIYQRNSGVSYAKVPFFADIPVLGFLFRNRRENDDRTEFLVFITPRIANRARALGN